VQVDLRVSSSASLAVEDLVAGYCEVLALDKVTITAAAATITAVLGANGAGKTTLLRAISGMVRPRSGRVLFDGADRAGSSPEDMARAGIAHVPEGQGVIAELTVEENLRITLSGLLESFAKQGGATVNGNALTAGIITDGYAPSVGDTSNSWITLFKKIHDQYDPKAPFDGNVLYGMGAAYTFVQAMFLGAGTRAGPTWCRRSTPGCRRVRWSPPSLIHRPITTVSPAPTSASSTTVS
jgi:ABC-type Fe3+/spermidine/putrescine transport system ATPase subunit